MAQQKTDAEIRGEQELAAAKEARDKAALEGGQVEETKESGETMTVPTALLRQLQEQLAQADMDREADRGRMAALEAMVDDVKGADTLGEEKLREKKNFEPKFRTLRLRKMAMKGEEDNQGIVIGWTQKGAYQKVDRSGVAPQMIDYIDIFFLGHERNADGVLQAETVKLLDLLSAPQIACKILKMEKDFHKEPTGEEINVTVFDPAHGLISSGDTIDGWIGFTDVKYTIQVPNVIEPVEVDGMFVN